MNVVCRTEHFTHKMVEDKNPAQDMVDIAGHVEQEDPSYEKDIVEIKLPDSVASFDYGGNFVKDVCIDDGQPLPRKISEDKVVDEKSCPNFDCQMIHANGAPTYTEKDSAAKSFRKPKPETLLPVDFAPDSNNEKTYSSCEKHDPEGRSKATNFCDLSEKKVSLEELLKIESAEESLHKSAISSETSKNHVPPFHGEAVGQVSPNVYRGVEAIASKTSGLVNDIVSSKNNIDDCSVTTSEECDAEASFDVRGQNLIDHYNPFVGHGSLEDTCKPECSTSTITDAASTEPICTFEKTDIVSAEGFDEIETSEPRVNALSSIGSEIQLSAKSNDQNGSIMGETITNNVHETEAATTSSADNVEANDANWENSEKHETGGTADIHDSSQIDEGTNNDAVSKSSLLAQHDNMCEQNAPDSAKAPPRIGNGYPPFEPGLFGPSIMSAPVSNSGHLAYSGNISIRSDSSTTSTRSFAFPVLQKDWISSPVRMAKGERRRTKRRRGWRKGLLCCKF
ncbi:uncharacterized protein LOC123404552 isoform X1 [Hordeum vulgare subsp. vulgare]|uniref:uncharacterized protein LOC123404552 isoform X1 n=2 Tax=Hordeum vulgare subsp. vulgare TaxID=112509 RepID=UPI0002954480|nr:uncharacterized protein LOC123404552 isoform X1 [Hordeum vulgare subsp. vulgare]XP_044954413.1 uncharacterized protein LOC123404552 isoform X1 [Hordeum vulgare subsp. vulgare]XP_044954414.1 uncharacterized protein LOC123404552 isoform X1 [Hordeum vulgare subsp. vulgare]XP_044954415.1 uncharacterized protein LOC123404552 isoform X1 [Hordeum vulgare subsp. vulgare]